MQQSLLIQDPTHPGTVYLFESLVEAAQTATEWRALFAFATRDGVEKLLEDEAFADFFARGGVASLTVGIDAVTNRAALERLNDLDAKYAGLTPTVFWTPTNSLFHPKLSHFRFPDGSERLIVGSGNLTPGGLSGNFEAYSVVTATPDEELDVSDLDEFLIRHAGDIRPIDQAALDRAAKNIIQRVRGRVQVIPADALDDAVPAPAQPPQGDAAQPAPAAPQTEPAPDAGGAAAGPETNVRPNQRVMIAQVPAAGGRWEQAHFNAAVIGQFFRVTNVDSQRVFLTFVQPNGARGVEHPRVVVFSDRNKNYKIEVENPTGRAYPNEGRPILVMLEMGVRAIEYTLLFPGDAGHQAMFDLTEQLPSVGKGLPRVITDAGTLRGTWPGAPFFLPPV